MFILLITLMSAIGANAQEAYACYTESNTTLTFYYDNLRSSREGTTYDLNTGSADTEWDTDDTKSNVTKVVFDPSFADARPTTTCDWFCNMENLQSITGMSYLNTSEVTNMLWMFMACTKLTSLDLSSFNTSKVTDMQFMFYGCHALKSLDLSSFNTSNEINMNRMFNDCRNLETIYVGEGWSTAAVMSSTDMFYDCTKLVGGKGTTYDANHVDKTYAHIDGGSSNPGYFTDGSARQAYAVYTEDNTTLTFYYDTQRDSRGGTTYDLNLNNYPRWASDATYDRVTEVVFDPSFASARPTSTYAWFYGMTNLTNITGMNYLNTSKVTNMNQMFYYCSSLKSLDICHFNTSEVTDMGYMFMLCNNLQTIYVGDGWSTAAVTQSTNMFSNCTSLVGGRGTIYNDSNPKDKTYARIDGGTGNPGYFSDPPEAYACYTPSNTTLTFYYDSQRDSREGTTYDLNTEGNDPGWYTDETYGKVTKVVFDPTFANARPTSTYGWFYFMFSLQSIEGISYLNTSEVTNMAWMFGYCTKLTSLDLSHFNTSKVNRMYDMFYGCENLQTIYVGNGWNTAAVTYSYSASMFYNCTKLVGGKGTTYDANHVDKTYAHIDGGTNNPGYFSEKPNEAYTCYTPENTTLTFYYDNKRSSREGTTYDLNTGSTQPGWNADGTESKVTQVVFDPSFAGARPTSTYEWFDSMYLLEFITGMNYLNTSEVTNMSWMFSGCTKLKSLDLSSFNTSKVTLMVRMFSACSLLTSLDLSSFNTSNITVLNYMFAGSRNLLTIYVSNGWNTDAARSVQMFTGCSSLVGEKGTSYDENYVDGSYAHIDGGTSNPGYFTEKPKEAYACYTSGNTTLTFYYDNQRNSRPGTTYDLNTGKNATGWDTDGTKSSVTKVVFDPSFAEVRPTTTYRWFYQMTNLESIEGICYLNTSEVTNMFGMFAVCKKLTVLDLSSFNTAQVTDMGAMFWKCSELQTIYVGEGWSIAAVTGSSRMFEDCTKLKGGQGTKYSSSHVEKPYAHIDGGPSYPGYFTARNIGITTRIENGQRESVKGQSEEWFTIDGQKLSGKPTKKGVYIYNGRAVVL
jgi:surface protein